MSEERFDVVVVGGGSSGCVAAGVIAERSSLRVLLLESGPEADENPETLRSDGYKDAFANDRVIWERFSEPQRFAGRQRIFLGSGTGMGGSGAVNGMVYTRGAREDYAEWPEGFRWDDVVPDFEAIEARLRPHTRPPTEFTEAFIRAAEGAGFRRSKDLNDGNLSGVVGYEWMNYEGEHRRSSYVAFVRETPRPNLVVRTGARVHRLVFDADRRVTAVEYAVGGELRRVGVDREVVMAAGALETPKLLMLSGIGPAEELRRHGIPIVHAHEAIGRNLHDHPNVPVFFAADREVDCDYPQLYSFHRANERSSLPRGQSDTCYVLYPFRSSFAQLAERMVPVKVLPPWLYDSPARELVRKGVRAAFATDVVQRWSRRMYGIIVILGKPKSRGSLVLRSPDPAAQAVIDPAYFSHPEDMETVIAGLRKARAIAEGLAAEGNRELMPGKRSVSDRALARYAERNAITTYHYAGTVRLGDDEASGCDLSLRLRGVRGVRIADASAIPVTPVSALNAPSMLLGYRAARSLLAGLV
ncbi:MAG: GMC family oxidoreductase [Myxococcales bacterium]|nr:GMC family oxidoreductase [Myxococcales bacterium]